GHTTLTGACGSCAVVTTLAVVAPTSMMRAVLSFTATNRIGPVAGGAGAGVPASPLVAIADPEPALEPDPGAGFRSCLQAMTARTRAALIARSSHVTDPGGAI